MQKRPLFLPCLILVLGVLALPGLRAADYKNKNAPLEERVADLLGKLTPDEKLLLLSGTGFTTQPIKRLGVPAMSMVDAGQGVRGGGGGTTGPATAFPSGVAMASSWDIDLLKRIGKAIGEEARNKGPGSEVLLGPAVNIHRSPLGGRNGEYFSEDPHLAARLGVAYIQGMQSTGTAACLKHYACNNEEQDRDFVDVNVGERALREIYLPAFEAGVKDGKAWTVMSSYNQVNGKHSSANPYLLIDVLKKGWGFDGLVMSDWGGVHETAVAQAGNDLEMPGRNLATPPKLKAALASGALTQAAVDESAKRILRTVIRTGLLDGPMHPNAGMVNSKEHQQLAYEAATKGIILLKNEGGILPLDRKTIRTIAVIGESAKNFQVGALGSPEVRPLNPPVQIVDAIVKAAGPGLTVNYAAGAAGGIPLPASAVTAPGTSTHGFQAEYFDGVDLAGTPIFKRVENQIQLNTKNSPAPGVPTQNYSVRWTAKLTAPDTGTYSIAFSGDDGYRVFLDNKEIISSWKAGRISTISGLVDLKAGQIYDLRAEFFQAKGDAIAKLDWTPPSSTPYADAVAAAKKSQVAVVCVSTHRGEGEGNDRGSLILPADQDMLVRSVAAANKNTIVVINNGTPVSMKAWIDTVPAIVETWFPGQEGGLALAAVLFGDVNPSGKLPDTLAVNREDYPDNGNFPGKDGHVNYAEGIYVGYRHFDKRGIAPLFPFGHGLSYTTFDYKNLKLSQPELKPDGSVQVSVDVTNTGKREGAEVVQLYVHDDKPQIDKPVRELKGFSKIDLKPGETKTATFTLTPRDLAYFDVPGKQWKADAGTYDIEIGASSRDIRQKAPLALGEVFTEKVPLSQDLSKN